VQGHPSYRVAQRNRGRHLSMNERDSSAIESFEAEIIRVIKRLRRGQLASYGEIAEEAGFPGAARAVGGVLSRNDGLPWWRVLRADGRLVSPNQKEQARLLKKEGVRIDRDRVVGRR
ncbi:MAG: MGMT family protein, partial [Acidimicrobiia bacterium]